MEIETLSSYEQKRDNGLDNTMDVDLQTNEEESISPVNEVYEETTESQESKVKETDRADQKETTLVESESDDECEEEEEKLLLSPAHSDGGEPLSPVNRDLLDSDCEGEKDEDDDKPRTQNVSEKEFNKVVKQDNDEDSDKLATENSNEEESAKPATQDLIEKNSNKLDNENESDKQDVADSVITKKDNKSPTEIKKKDDLVEKPSSIESNDTNDNKSESNRADSNLEHKNVECDQIEESIRNKAEKVPTKKGNAKEKSEEHQNEDSLIEKNYKEELEVDKVKISDENVSFKKEAEVKPEETIVEHKEEVNDLRKTKEIMETKDKVKKVEKDTKDGATVDMKIKMNEKEVKLKETNVKRVPEKINEHIKQKDNEKSNEDKQSNEGDLLSKENNSQPPETEEEMDMDEDFDPTLLMPELSMEVDEAPVITTSDGPAPESDGNKSPLRLYDPIFSTFVDEMTGAEVDFDLSTEELELKVKTYGTKNPVQFTKIHCTACNIHLGSALDGQGNRFVHPLLKVLICKKCYHFYTSGEFEKDEDGSELYCRWCGQGGQVMCCSNCEMVFCKKCIRINFDRKKLTEIQRSEDWTCFRCNPSQLIHLRIHCAEFMEYVQREIRNVGSSGNPEAFMNTDYCQCCIPQKKDKKPPETTAPTQTRKRKRNVTEEDPDYNPVIEQDSPPPSSPATPTPPPTKMPALTPRPPAPTSTLAKPPLLRAVTPLQSRPRMPIVTAGIRSQTSSIRPQTSNVRPQAGYVRVAPGGVRGTTPTTIVPTRPPALRPLRPVTPSPKHEWFEKTVRAAARVNSNLSYTLTQLNRAQANATSVEALAVVHNKLQEILSSSINSLIQIRKNLRTEFIAGIKNIRFPPKPQPTPTPPTSSSLKDDDDVIFIPSDPTPSTTAVPPKITKVVQNPSPNLPPGISLIKKTTSSTTPPSVSITVSKAGPSGVNKNTNTNQSKTTDNNSNIQPKGFLRVKSFLALQNVPSECITIPDDPADEADPEVQAVQEKDPLADDPPEKDEKSEDTSHTNGITNGDKTGDDKTISKLKEEDTLSQCSEGSDKSVKKAKIMLERSNEIDELVKSTFGVVNGDCDKTEEN